MEPVAAADLRISIDAFYGGIRWFLCVDQSRAERLGAGRKQLGGRLPARLLPDDEDKIWRQDRSGRCMAGLRRPEGLMEPGKTYFSALRRNACGYDEGISGEFTRRQPASIPPH